MTIIAVSMTLQEALERLRQGAWVRYRLWPELTHLRRFESFLCRPYRVSATVAHQGIWHSPALEEAMVDRWDEIQTSPEWDLTIQPYVRGCKGWAWDADVG